MKETPTYSIIIPHYNSPQLLQRCLDSIPMREDIQVIVVDDCSDSSIVLFSELPGHNRPNTEVYSTPIGGSAGRARNIGLQHAKGQWLLFADADDFFTSGAWEAFDRYTRSSFDIIYFDITSMDSDTLLPNDRKDVYGQFIRRYLQSPTLSNERMLRFRHDVPWGKMIRRQAVESTAIRFDETRWCNDTIFSTQTALMAQHIAVEATCTYCVTTIPASLTHHISLDAMLVRYEVQLRKNALLRTHRFHRYQISVLSYLKQAASYGIGTLWKLVRMGLHYRNPFFIRYTYWCYAQ